MPRYEITGPDGGRYEVDAPDDASLQAAAAMMFSGPAASAPAATPAPAAGFVAPEPPPGAVIHGGDGRSYVADHPEIGVARTAAPGSRDEAIQQHALRARGATDGTVSDVARAARPFAQGQSLAFGDELVSTIFGGVEALRGGSAADGYDFGQEFQKQELDRRRQEAPITSALTEAAGGLATGAAAAGSGATLVGRVANTGLGSLPKRMLAGAAEGAAYAGLSGAGGSDGDIGDRASAAARNAPLGAGIGAASVPAVDLIGTIFGTARNAVVGLRNPEGRADELLVQRLTKDRQTPETLATAVERAAAAGQGEYRALDAAGRNTQRLGAMAAKTPGPFRDSSAQTLAARQAGQGDRIGSFVDDAVAPGGKAYSTEQGLIEGRRAAAQPLYDKAYAAPTPQGAFYAETLGRQSVQDAIKAAERTAAEKQIPVTDLFAEIPNPNPTTRQVPDGFMGPNGSAPAMRDEVVDATVRVPTMRGWDYVKRELDAKVNQLYKAGDTTAAEAVKETRNALRQQLSSDNPDYAAALAQYADDSASLEAIQTGRDLVNARNPDEARAAFGKGTPAQKELGKVGASREIGVKLDNMRAQQNKTQVFDTPAMKGKLDTLVEDPVVRAVLNDRLQRERDMVRATTAMTGRSDTAENIADGADIDSTASILTALARGSVTQAIARGVGSMTGAVSRGLTGMNEQTASRVGQFLMSAEPQEIRKLSDLFRQTEQAAARPSRAAPAAIGGLNAPRHPAERR